MQNNKIKYYLKEMKSYSKSCNVRFYLLLVITIFIQLFNEVSAYYSSLLVDYVTTSEAISVIWQLASIIFAVYLLCTAISIAKAYVNTKVSCNLEYGIREQFLNVIQQSTYLSTMSKEATEVYYRLLNDVGNMTSFYMELRISIPTNIISVIACSFLMLYWEPILTALIIFFTLIQVFATHKIKKPISVSSMEVMETENSFVKAVGEIFTGIENIKVLGAEEYNVKKIKKLTDVIKQARIKNTYVISLLSSIIGTMGQFGSILLLIIGCYLIHAGNMTIGKYIGFVSVVGLFSDSVNNIISLIFKYETVRVSYDRYIEFCKEYDVCGYGGHKTFNCEQSLKLSHVSFSYLPEIEVLKDINAEFIPGHMVAIIGESGCGKSTLGKLLMRLLKFTKGEITLDGVDYVAIKHEEYKHNVSYMSQIPFVFSGTIKENLMVGFDGELDEEYMSDVLKNTGMISILKKMPDGLETVVGKDGIMMSVGEMQRLAMARVLLRKPKIVILDEPTSSLNIKYDKLVVDIFDKYAKMYNAVVIIITHKETTITMLNEVYILKDGNLVKSKSRNFFGN